MKTVFMGTPDFAVETLKALTKKHQVLAVITQPDKQKGRGKKLMFPPVKEYALENNIPVFQPEKISDKDFLQVLEGFNADIFVVVAYGQLLPEAVLNMPRLGCINVHGSLLPKYRGAGPIQWAIINGEEKTGVTVMYMAKSLDSGDMILKKEVEIDKNDTFGSLHDKMAIAGADACTEALELFEKGLVSAEKQDEGLSNYAPKITKETALINWENTSEKIRNLIRGLNPVPCAYTYYNEEAFKIWQAEEITDKSYAGRPGEIVDFINKGGFVVKTGDTALHITEMQAKGGKKMKTADYLRGHRVEKGIILK